VLFKNSEASANPITQTRFAPFKNWRGFTHGLGEFLEGRKERREFQK
jgi:hypothetical protein